MDRDDLEPRKRRDEALAALAKEDLSLLGIEELEERITALEGEIARIRDQLVKKRGSLSAAEALFKK
ncbi:MAG: DUF1192 domain-containing protein [Parvibaculum sp.]|uniref:DUF1192 domain-containing protein n=1 Tax=Parvibaculum sp. TaxID=2024848 RepID=UPI000CA67C61|nr:DUF1192 domain-containing protein [Parvibaculum sp.]PKQ06770.1 MAG: DUF1192 domain-containing protein [Alphaproteobacteria bacterium HGW-Alphaproteobacteria-11]MBX3489018.1 DUF1192 domain-containing protein [Parvibaculum sp.]MBX3491670.1 DUF1192 domain-containing protein [Parvibaculum sp.]MBX3496556.1 DUF1192 domain-containing protein [Parvibaculum sp.]MCW5727113.1 DUF1192 domain-containing protein [Parvibaculum sp.]